MQCVSCYLLVLSDAKDTLSNTNRNILSKDWIFQIKENWTTDLIFPHDTSCRQDESKAEKEHYLLSF